MKKLLSLLLLSLSLSCFAKTVELTPTNHYFLQENVTGPSMAMAFNELRALDRLLPKGAPIYLVLKTNGGSVIAGMEFIRQAKQLSRPITTITIHAFSMGFQIAQGLGRRLVVTSGVFMAHPIAGRCEGRPIQIASCLEFMIELADSMDRVAAKRLKMSLKDYQLKTSEEWWILDQSAVDKNVADEVVDIMCHKDLVTCPN